MFVGVTSCVFVVFGMKTTSKFINTPQDVTQTCGAATKLISDSAQVEKSEHVKDILQHLVTEDWQLEAITRIRTFVNAHTRI